jgi:ADP-ribose pyrophosphatase
MDSPIRLLQSRWLHQGRISKLRLDEVVLPRGTHDTYEYVEIKPGVSVLAMEENNDVWLVREWKYAVGRLSLEVVSGGIEEDEQPLAAGIRELQEEVGATATNWTDLGFVDPFTTMLKCPNYMFLARGLDHVGHQHEEGEIMEVLRVPFEQAYEHVLNGEITHGTSCVTIFRVAALLGLCGRAPQAGR